ncbi:unnamed protein product [Paramecium octaurelia]|uniref:Uncharacterized protein n=1 Tax=Paramecium octaurelia TaxID=43137 RepID=A0A8S1U4U7_PAROT|nr:unnamed protein product [Paramecium octaurelia]
MNIEKLFINELLVTHLIRVRKNKFHKLASDCKNYKIIECDLRKITKKILIINWNQQR